MIVTPMFNAARGSILIAILFHLQINLPIWPEAQPWENYLFALMAVIIVIVCRKSMINGVGVTEILAPPSTERRPGDGTSVPAPASNASPSSRSATSTSERRL